LKGAQAKQKQARIAFSAQLLSLNCTASPLIRRRGVLLARVAVQKSASFPPRVRNADSWTKATRDQ